MKFLKYREDGDLDTVNIWGLCKGGEIYKYCEETLIHLENQGDGFIISSYVDNATRRNSSLSSAALMGSLMGGVIGGIAATLVTQAGTEKLLPVKSIPYITKEKKQPEATCIDMKTGELSF